MFHDTRLGNAIVLAAFACAAAVQPAGAQTVVQNSAPASPAITDLFTFNTHTGTASDRIVVAKFVVDTASADLNLGLMLQMNGTSVNFRIDDQNVNVADPEDPEVSMATLRLRNLSATESSAPGYSILKATIRYNDSYNFGAGQSWTIHALGAPSTVRYIGYWHEGVGEEAVEAVVTRPRLVENQADPANFATYTAYPNTKSISFGDVHINLSAAHVPERTWAFVNVGTAPLNITGVSPAPTGVYTVENYPSTPPTLTVLPMVTFSRQVSAQPTALGPVPNASVTFTAAAPASNLQLNLTNTTGVRLSSAILFDLSGSMLADKNNQTTSNDELRKMRPARIAALELVQLYHSILPEARLSLYSYPNTAGACPSSQQIIPWNTIQNNVLSFQQRLDVGLGHSTLINPQSTSAMTPMAEGIARVYEGLADRSQHERAAVFLFGDGEHNCDSSAPRRTPASWYNWSTFRNAGIPFFTIPYGAANASWLQTYQALADNTNGEAFPADVESDLELQIQFKKALGKALDLESLLDPIASVTAGQVREHAVCVSESAEQVVFSVHWAVRNPQAIGFTLRDPTGAAITSATETGPDVSFIAGENFANYVLRGSRLAGANGAGEWTLRVQGNESTSYAYQVYAKDEVRVEPTFDLAGVMVPGLFTFNIRDGMLHLQDVNVTASGTAPTASINNFLATTYVSPELIARVPEHIGRGASGLAERKLHALTHFTNTPPPSERMERQIRFTRQVGTTDRNQRLMQAAAAAPLQVAAQDLVYNAPIQDIRHAGLYNFDVQIRGTTKLGSCFQRHFVVSRWVDVRLTAALVAGAVAWQTAQHHEFLDAEVARLVASEPRAGFERRFIRFTPRDEHGNYLGLDRADDITFNVRGAEKRGLLQNLADGSYAQLVEFRAGSNPSVQVGVGDVGAPAVPLSAETGRRPWWLLLLIIVAAAAAALGTL